MALPEFNFRVSTSEEALKVAGTGGKFINDSGIYPITINFVSLEQSERGAYSYVLNVDYEGNSQTIYGPTIQNTNGEVNQIGARSLNSLLVIAGNENGQVPVIEEEEHAVGKDNEVRTFKVFTDLSGLECKVFLKRVYNKYKGEIKPKFEIITFFREPDNATAEEIIAKENGKDVEFGKQYVHLMEAESTTKYKLGKDENKNPVTEEEVQEYLEAKKSGKSSSANNSGPKEEKVIKRNFFS